MTTFAIANLSDLNFGGLSGSLIGDVSSVVSGQNLSVTIQPNVVTFAKFQQVAAASLVGNPTGSLANAAGITLGATLTFSASVLQTAAGTGDITWAANSFATTIAANAVTFAKFQQIPAVSLVGNSTAGSANAQSVTLGATLAFSGTVVQTGAATGDVTWAANSFATSIAASAVTTTKIANSAVTYAKLQNESANTLLGNANSISGAPFEVALGTTLLMSGNTTLITGAGTGDVTWNPNAFLTTIAANVVTNSKLAQAPANTFKGNNTGSTANVADLTITQTKAALNTAPQITVLTSGSGTYTTPTGALYLIVRAVGAGGGGSGAGTAGTGGTGGTGGDTTFGTSFLIAHGGVGGVDTSGSGGAGGSASGGDINITGQPGAPYDFPVSGASALGGWGGDSPFGLGFGGIGAGGGAGQAGSGSGGGGSGAGGNASFPGGSGGGAGGGLSKLITSPAASYAYAVGAAGTGGTAGTSGFVGGAGAGGIIIVEAYFQ